jgi:hypothetical protein
MNSKLKKPINFGKRIYRIHLYISESGQESLVGSDYRRLPSISFKKGDDYYWFWIGSHQDYDALLS